MFPQSIWLQQLPSKRHILPPNPCLPHGCTCCHERCVSLYPSSLEHGLCFSRNSVNDVDLMVEELVRWFPPRHTHCLCSRLSWSHPTRRPWRCEALSQYLAGISMWMDWWYLRSLLWDLLHEQWKKSQVPWSDFVAAKTSSCVNSRLIVTTSQQQIFKHQIKKLSTQWSGKSFLICSSCWLVYFRGHECAQRRCAVALVPTWNRHKILSEGRRHEPDIRGILERRQRPRLRQSTTTTRPLDHSECCSSCVTV